MTWAWIALGVFVAMVVVALAVGAIAKGGSRGDEPELSDDAIGDHPYVNETSAAQLAGRSARSRDDHDPSSFHAASMDGGDENFSHKKRQEVAHDLR